MFRQEDDKSAFLAEAGYTLATADRLERDLREQVLALEATPLPDRGFGDRFEIRGRLQGLTGTLAVRTIWMRERSTGIWKFITLVPDKEASP